MPQLRSNSFGPRAGSIGAPGSGTAAQVSASPQDNVPKLYPAAPSGIVNQPVTAAGPPWFLAGDPATFTVTGNVAGIKVSRQLAGATGVYVVTGNSGVTRLTHSIAGATGVYTETGSAAGIIVLRKLAGATGAYAETGNAGLFKLVLAGGIQYNLLGGTGTYLAAGSDGLFKLIAAGPQGGISGYLRPRKMRSRTMMVQPMRKATRRAEEIMVGWRDEEEALIVIQIIDTF